MLKSLLKFNELWEYKPIFFVSIAVKSRDTSPVLPVPISVVICLKELFASVQVNWSKSKQLTVVDAWSVKYNTGDYQRVHNHSSVGLSGILYVDVPQDAPFLDIIQPWNSWVTDKTEISSVKFKEGGLVVFPSFIQHGTQPNESRQAKRVIAFDMKIV